MLLGKECLLAPRTEIESVHSPSHQRCRELPEKQPGEPPLLPLMLSVPGTWKPEGLPCKGVCSRSCFPCVTQKLLPLAHPGDLDCPDGTSQRCPGVARGGPQSRSHASLTCFQRHALVACNLPQRMTPQRWTIAASRCPVPLTRVVQCPWARRGSPPHPSHPLCPAEGSLFGLKEEIPFRVSTRGACCVRAGVPSCCPLLDWLRARGGAGCVQKIPSALVLFRSLIS